MNPKIFCLILNYRHHQDTLSCVRHLEDADLPRDSQIIILDNTEDNSSYQALKKALPKHKIIKNKANLGFAAGNNVGVRHALKNKATHVLIINPDVKVPERFFAPFLKHFKTNPRLGLVGPALKHKVKNKTYYGLDGYMDWDFAKPQHHSIARVPSKKPIRAQFLTFACVLINAELLKQNLLDERYFMYLEDVDFGLTAKKLGYELILDSSVIATHQTSASFSHPRHKLKISYKSHIKFIFKWLIFPHNLIAASYQSLHYPYLYFLWTYHHWRYRPTSTK